MHLPWKLHVYVVILLLFVSGLLVHTLEPQRYHRHQLQYSQISSNYRQQSPADMGLQPAFVLEQFPVLDLQESKNTDDDPKPSDLNATLLLSILGDRFNASVMSIDPPFKNPGYPQKLPAFGYHRNKHGKLVRAGKMPEFLTEMDYKYTVLTDKWKVRTRITSKLQRKIQQFLWSYTFCPVSHQWKDLGSRFWPQYLQVGHCSNRRSCSVPPGMTCSPSNMAYHTLLRWWCKSTPTRYIEDDNFLSASRSCRWIESKYPVITECSCSCPPIKPEEAR